MHDYMPASEAARKASAGKAESVSADDDRLFSASTTEQKWDCSRQLLSVHALCCKASSLISPCKLAVLTIMMCFHSKRH